MKHSMKYDSSIAKIAKHRPSASVAVFLLAAGLLAVSILSAYSSAGAFGVSAVICSPEWHCTNYSETTCGTRTCIDGQACGTNYNKPLESVACPQGGVGTGKSTPENQTAAQDSQAEEESPEKEYYFIIDSYMKKIEMYQDEEKTVEIGLLPLDTQEVSLELTSDFLDPYILIRPESYVIYLEKDVRAFARLRIKNLDLEPGTYPVLLYIKSPTFTEKVRIIITVHSRNSSIDFDVSVDAALDNDATRFEATLYNIDSLANIPAANITFILFSEEGTSVYAEKEEIDLSREVRKSIVIDSLLSPGYYVLSVIIEARGTKSVNTHSFSVIGSEYSPVEETPGKVPEPRDAKRETLKYLLAAFIAVGAGICIWASRTAMPKASTRTPKKLEKK